ncbi:hypothetical protein PTKIN_Ptkin11bG0020600 [Pterospermum kingtungense]
MEWKVLMPDSNLRRLRELECPMISSADFFQLAGVIAVEITGGPEIPFHPGRKDHANMILSDQNYVALAGGQNMGKWRVGKDGNWKMLLVLAKEGNGHYKTPIDAILMSNPAYRILVEKYAADENAFFADYTAAYLKLTESNFLDA